jgi:FkbM family methyltransferase
MSSRDLARAACREAHHFKALLAALGITPKVAWDIGANVGLYSLALISAYPEMSVHAFEPVRLNFDELRLNVASNRRDGQIIPHHCGLSDEVATLSMGIPSHRESDNTGLYSILYADQSRGKDLVEGCRFLTAEEALKSCVSLPDIVKIDVEGAEMRVLTTLARVDEQAIRAVIVEVNEDQHFASPHEVTRHLQDHGFQPIYPDLDFISPMGKRGRKSYNRLWARV